MRTLDEFNDAFPVQINLPVQWGDMDAFGHVNNTMYFRYFESARLAYMAEMKLLETIQKEQIGPVLAETNCRFKSPLTYPDNIRVGTSVVELQEYGFLMRYAIYSETQKRIVSEGSGRIVLLGFKSGLKVKLGENIQKAIEALES